MSACRELCVPGPKQRAYGLGPGVHGLRLLVSPSGTGAWVQRLWYGNRSVDRGLGSLDYVSLAEAKRVAFRNKAAKVLAKAEDNAFPDAPPAPRKRAVLPATPPVTFESVYRDVLAERAAAAKNPTDTRRQWESRLAVIPALAGKPVAAVTRADVLAVFETPCNCGKGRCDGSAYWTAHAKVATDMLARISATMDKAVGRGLIPANPVDGALRAALPKRNGKGGTQHHAAIPYRELPDAMRTLEGSRAGTALALRFIALTAVRLGEAVGADWAEIDMETATWTIPASRMKAGETHTVPLSDAALAVLDEARMASGGTGLVFKGRGGPLSRDGLWRTWKRLGCAGTVHGLRSAFRDWCGDTGKPRELAEASLAHAVGDAVERAYARSTMLERRRVVMDEWGSYLAETGADASDKCR